MSFGDGLLIGCLIMFPFVLLWRREALKPPEASPDAEQ
jgi:hypothetical protein